MREYGRGGSCGHLKRALEHCDVEAPFATNAPGAGNAALSQLMVGSPLVEFEHGCDAFRAPNDSEGRGGLSSFVVRIHLIFLSKTKSPEQFPVREPRYFQVLPRFL